MEKETLEEAMNNNGYHDQTSDNLWRDGVKFSAKWQAERMYSEEEAGELAYNVIGEYAKQCGIIVDGAKLNDLFGQFKKEINMEAFGTLAGLALVIIAMAILYNGGITITIKKNK